MSVSYLRCFVAAAALSLLWVSAQAAPRMTAVEDALEADTTTVALPTTNDGTILRKDCQDCNDNPLRLTADSQFIVQGKAATLDQLNALLQQSKSGRGLTIFYRIGTRVVTRIIVN